MQPHLPHGVTAPDRPVAVRPLLVDVGAANGHRLFVLSIEDWGLWADLRFARVASPGAEPLARRIPLAKDWSISIDGTPAEVVDVAGRGDRGFSNGEVRFLPAPPPGARLLLRALFAPNTELQVELIVPGA